MKLGKIEMAHKTAIRVQAEILAELWVDYRDDEGFQSYIEYNDLGLPLAYAVANDIVECTDKVERYIDEAFIVLLASLKIQDSGFENLHDVLSSAESKPE
jgi:hypothetical protein